MCRVLKYSALESNIHFPLQKVNMISVFNFFVLDETASLHDNSFALAWMVVGWC